MNARILRLTAVCAVLIPSLSSAVALDHQGRGCTERGEKSLGSLHVGCGGPVRPLPVDDWCPTLPRSPWPHRPAPMPMPRWPGQNGL